VRLVFRAKRSLKRPDPRKAFLAVSSANLAGRPSGLERAFGSRFENCFRDSDSEVRTQQLVGLTYRKLRPRDSGECAEDEGPGITSQVLLAELALPADEMYSFELPESREKFSRTAPARIGTPL
jgi:hypothetical protein